MTVYICIYRARTDLALSLDAIYFARFLYVSIPPDDRPTRRTRAHSTPNNIIIYYSGKTWLQWPARLCGAAAAATLFNCRNEILSASPQRTRRRRTPKSVPWGVRSTYRRRCTLHGERDRFGRPDRVSQSTYTHSSYNITHCTFSAAHDSPRANARPAHPSPTLFCIRTRNANDANAWCPHDDNNECVEDR